VEEDLHVGEGEIGAAEQLDHPEELGFLVDAQFPGDDRITGQGEGESVLRGGARGGEAGEEQC